MDVLAGPEEALEAINDDVDEQDYEEINGEEDVAGKSHRS